VQPEQTAIYSSVAPMLKKIDFFCMDFFFWRVLFE